MSERKLVDLNGPEIPETVKDIMDDESRDRVEIKPWLKSNNKMD